MQEQGRDKKPALLCLFKQVEKEKKRIERGKKPWNPHFLPWLDIYVSIFVYNGVLCWRVVLLSGLTWWMNARTGPDLDVCFTSSNVFHGSHPPIHRASLHPRMADLMGPFIIYMGGERRVGGKSSGRKGKWQESLFQAQECKELMPLTKCSFTIS